MLSPLARVRALGRHLFELARHGFWERAWRLIWNSEPANRFADGRAQALASEPVAVSVTYDQWLSPVSKAAPGADAESLARLVGPRPSFFPMAVYRDWLKSAPAYNARWAHICEGQMPEEATPREIIVVRGMA